MAYIRKRGDFQWQAEIRKKGFPPASRTFNTRAEAEAWAAVIESEMVRGVFVDRSEAESTTLYEALERYEREVTPGKDGERQELVRIKSWKANNLAKRSLASLRGADFAKFRNDRLKSVRPSTVQKDLAVISHLFNHARKEWGIAVSNPIADIKMPTEDNSRDRRLEGDEEQRLFKELEPVHGRSIWMQPLVELALETAARQSELLSLDWPDINMTKRVARIRGKKRADGKRRTKNRDKFRDVPLSSRALKVLSSLPHNISGKLFQVSQRVVINAFSEACKRAGIEDLTFHDLRHEATSRLAEKLALHELMKVTGHSSTRMLARYYHPRAEDLAKKLG